MVKVKVGKFFVFIDSKFWRVEVKLKEKDYTRKLKLRRGIFPRILYNIQVGDKQYNKVSLPRLYLLQVTTDRKVYQPGEKARILITNLGHPNSSVDLTIYLNENIFYRDRINVDKFGFASLELDDLDSGKYRVEATWRGYTAYSDFIVSPYKLSILQAFLRKYKLENSNFSAAIELSKLNIPFSGVCSVSLHCDFCNFTIAKKSIEFKNGIGEVNFDIGNHNGPFKLHLILEDGTATSLSIPHTEREEQEKVILSAAGKIFTASLIPIEESVKIKGLYITETGSRVSPILLDNVISERFKLMVLEDFLILSVVLYNPFTGQVNTYELNDVKKDSILTFDTFKPLTFVFIGGLNDEIYETSFVLVSPEKLKVDVDAPQYAIPGKELKILIKSNMKARGVLIIYDSRLEHESLVNKLAKNLYKNIKSLRKLEVKKIRSVKAVQRLELPFLIRAIAPLPKGETVFEEAQESEIVVEKSGLALVQFRTATIPLAFFDVFEIDGETVKKIRVGSYPALWKIKFYAFADVDYLEREYVIETSKPVMLEIDAPVYLEEGEEVIARVNYVASGKAELHIETPWNKIRKFVEGSGVETLVLKGPCKIKAYIVKDDFSDAVEFEVGKPGVERVKFSKLILLNKNEEIYGERIVLYPSPIYLAKDLVNALIQYPFGCAEQTSSKLAGLGVVYKAAKKGILKEDLENLEKLIKFGIARMRIFYKDGLFSLWEFGKPEVSVTIKVLRNLRHLYKIGFKEIDEIIEKSVSRLLENDVKDNDLLAYDSRFRSDISSVEDAVNVYLYSKEDKAKKEALKFILGEVEEKDNIAYWHASKSWAGILEATCEALKVVYLAGYKDLFRKGFAFISSKLVNGMLYTTSDTRAFIELASLLPVSNCSKVRVDDRMIEVDSMTIVEDRVKALTDFVLARVDYEDTINLFETKGKLKYSIELSPKVLNTGEKAVLKITINNDYFVPIAKIWLSGNLAALEGGANVQVIHQPIKENILKIEVVAIRMGIANIRSLVYDMYDSNKIGIALPIKVKVK